MKFFSKITIVGYDFSSTQLTITKLQHTKADPMWAPFTALRYKELGLLISAREVGLPISQIKSIHMMYLTNRLTTVSRDLSI